MYKLLNSWNERNNSIIIIKSIGNNSDSKRNSAMAEVEVMQTVTEVKKTKKLKKTSKHRESEVQITEVDQANLDKGYVSSLWNSASKKTNRSKIPPPTKWSERIKDSLRCDVNVEEVSTLRTGLIDSCPMNSLRQKWSNVPIKNLGCTSFLFDL